MNDIVVDAAMNPRETTVTLTLRGFATATEAQEATRTLATQWRVAEDHVSIDGAGPGLAFADALGVAPR